MEAVERTAVVSRRPRVVELDELNRVFPARRLLPLGRGRRPGVERELAVEALGQPRAAVDAGTRGHRVAYNDLW